MHTDADHELLRRYAEHGDEQAFTELVQRHLNLVWAAALRVSGNTDLARDVAQTVFSDLARKAGSLPQDAILAGWLYRAARLAATNQVRGETRRVLREQHAMATQDPICSDSTGNHAAEALQPLLDSALAELSEADRNAVVLRFLAGRSLAEVGAALGISEDTAQKRVSRALDKLREAFRRRGVNIAGGAMAAALNLAAAETAPIGAASGITAGALALGGTAGGTGAWLLIMKSKLTLGIVGGAAVVAALSWQQLNLNRLTDENSALRGQLAATSTASPPLRTTNPTEAEAFARLEAQQEELLRLRGEVAQLRLAARQPTANATTAPVLTPGDIDALATEKLIAEATANKMIVAMKNLGLAVRIFSTDHQNQLPSTFEEMKTEIEGLSPDGNLPGGVPLELFEFFLHQRAISQSEPQMILFQEKRPRRLPNGTWECIYCLIDGSVLRINRPEGDFSEFELPRTATPANAPGKP
jgi:RNA polymerase sigma factor (sigma-70 family)